jgi:dolichol-phosphate mannosyltransferase
VGNLIIIPIYNEEQHIEGVLKKVRENSDSDILVVNDGSTDNSLEIINLIPPYPPLLKGGRGGLKAITHHGNQGYGKSLIDGFDFAISQGCEYTVTMDCDEQHEPHLIPVFLKEIDLPLIPSLRRRGEGRFLDVISGSRYLKDFPSNNPPPQDRKYINEQITEIINRITGYNLTDSFCGFKAYRVDSLKKLKLTEWGYGMPLQLWIQAWRNNLNVKEYPIERIYKNMDRSFGKEMDDPEKRLAYYKRIIEIELKIED